jgi:hypothetical protein
VSAVASSYAVERPKQKQFTTGQPSDQMCVLCREVMAIVEPFIKRMDKVIDAVGRDGGQNGGVNWLASEWARISGRTEEAAVRRIYSYRNEAISMTAHMADELLMACGEYIEDYDDQLTYFCGGHKAAKEQAELYAEDRSQMGLARYAKQEWERTERIIMAERAKRDGCN